MNTMTAPRIDTAPAPSAATLTAAATAAELAAAVQTPGLLAAVQADASALYQEARMVGGGVLAQLVDQAWTGFLRRAAASKHPRGAWALAAERAACDVAALRVALEARACFARVAKMNWQEARAEYERLRQGHAIAASLAQQAAAANHAPVAPLSAREQANALIGRLAARGIALREVYDRDKGRSSVMASPAGRLTPEDTAAIKHLLDGMGDDVRDEFLGALNGGDLIA